MKRAFFVVVFLLLASALFAQSPGPPQGQRLQDTVYTSEGEYLVVYGYEGQLVGSGIDINSYEQWITPQMLRDGLRPLDKLSNGQWECVRKMLNRYQITAGDIYYIGMVRAQYTTLMVAVFCVFTSNTEYNWWAFVRYL